MVIVALLGLVGMWWLGEVRPAQRHDARFASPTELVLDDLVAEYQRDAVAAHAKWKDKAIRFTAPTMGHSSDSNMKLAARTGSADCWFMETAEGEGAHLYAPGQQASITAVVRDWDGSWQTLSLMCKLQR